MTLALRGLLTGQREAIVLTVFGDLSPGQATAAMRVSRASLRRRLAEARSALRAVLPFRPLSASRTATGSVRRPARQPRRDKEPDRGNPRTAGQSWQKSSGLLHRATDPLAPAQPSAGTCPDVG